MNERRLILGLKRGDYKSYEILFDLYYARFVNFADSIIRDRAAAKDIVQEAFVRIWLSRARLNENQSLESYIYVIVKRLIFNYLRDRKPTETIDSESVAAMNDNAWGGARPYPCRQ